jgi:hypothetical protein
VVTKKIKQPGEFLQHAFGAVAQQRRVYKAWLKQSSLIYICDSDMQTIFVCVRFTWFYMKNTLDFIFTDGLI